MSSGDNTANVDSRIRTTILAFIVATLCYLSARLAGALVIFVPQTVWPLWPGCALLVAILLLVPRKIWPVLLPAGLAGFVLYDLQAAVPIPSIAWLILADTLEILVAAWGVSYFLNGLPRLNSLNALAKYSFFTVFLAPLIVSSIGINGLGGDDWVNWRFSFLSEALAFLTVSPAILGLFDRDRRSLRASPAYYLEAAMMVAAVVSLSYFIFVAPTRSAPPALLYSLVPCLIWSALRFGSAGVGTSATIVALMSIWGAVHGRGPFDDADPINRVLSLQLFLFCTSIPFMVLAVLVEERKIAQDGLRESEERLRLAVQAGKMFACDWDATTDLFTHSPESVQILGIDQVISITGHQVRGNIHPEDRERFTAVAAELSPEKPDLRISYRMVRRDGTVIWMERNSRAHFDQQGRLLRIFGIVTDITERKRAEEALRASEERLRLAVEAGKMFAYEWDAATDVLVRSAESSQILGVDEVIPLTGQQILAQVHPDDRERLTAAIAELRPAQPSLSATYRMLRPDGTVIWVERNSRAQFDEQGKLVRIIGIVADITERKRTEDAVRQSEEKYRRIVETTNEGIWLLDSKFYTSFVNRQMAGMLGYQPGEMLGRSVFDFYFPEDVERKRQLLAHRRDGLSEHVDERFRRRDGAELWVRMAAIPISKDNGEFDGALAMMSDITERKRAEEALEKSEEKFSKAFWQSPMALAITSATDHRYIEVNESFEQFSGWRREELIGRTPFDIGLWVDPQERDKVARYVQNEGSLRLFEGHFRMRDGTIRTGLVGAELIELDGEPCVLAVGMDITEQKRAEEALRESEARFRLVADTAPALIWMSGTDKMFTFFNKGWLDFTGRSVDLELGNGWADGVHPEDLPHCLDVYARAFDARAEFSMEYRLRRFDGEYRWVLDIGVPRFNQDGSFAGFIGSCIDVSDRKLAEDALSGVNRKLIEAQERERARIARELHDDVGQRLALLTVELEQLRQMLVDSPADLLQRVEELRSHSSDIASDVQSLSHELHSSKLEYLGIATAMRAFCHELSVQHDAEIVFVHDEIPRNLSHEISLCLFRVAQEALQNAVKHSGVRHFDVELRYAPDAIQLTVRDSGSGFDVAESMRTSGLGLISMTERLKLVDGQLSIDSQAQRGTTIRASVPLRKAAKASA
jgi:PAS domain S-box-containing protein